MVRTLPGGTFTSSNTGGAAIPHGETGALEAYQRAIANATKFIYLEDQYIHRAGNLSCAAPTNGSEFRPWKF